jgi:hypothetical protein
MLSLELVTSLLFFSVESFLKLLYDFDCVDLVKFRGGFSRFPVAGSTLSIRPNEDVRAVKTKFAREFWLASGKEFAKKISRDNLKRLAFVDFVEILIPCERLFLDSYKLLFVLFHMIQKEERAKAMEI